MCLCIVQGSNGGNATMPAQPSDIGPPKTEGEPEIEPTLDEWGDDSIISHWGEGQWVKYDPDDIIEDVEEWA